MECLEASDAIMQENEGNLSNPNCQSDAEEENFSRLHCAPQKFDSQDFSESSLNESIQELLDCLPSWVTRPQIMSLLRDSGRNVVEAVTNFYERETEFHAAAFANTCSDCVNTVALLDKDCLDPESLVDKGLVPCKLTEYESASPPNLNAVEFTSRSQVPTSSQTSKLSSLGNVKKDLMSPGKRKKDSKNKQSKKPRTQSNLDKQHTITKFFSKVAPLGSRPGTSSEALGNVVDGVSGFKSK